MSYRAGAAIQDIEFVQFHPTALHLDEAPRFLLSEALRGDGAILRNAAGERFQDELASRDVVSRAIVREMARTGAPHMFLDMTHFAPGTMETHFPRIFETCLLYNLDLREKPAPVHPAAHYSTAEQPSAGCSPRGRWRAPACTERIAWRVIHCWKGSSSGPGQQKQ